MKESSQPREQPHQVVDDISFKGLVPAGTEDKASQKNKKDEENANGGSEANQRSRRPITRDSQHGRLSVRGRYNFNIPTQQGAQDHVEDIHGKTSWRWNVLEFLHQKRVQFTLMGLLLLDVFILFFELFLLTQYPHCKVIERDCISCCPHASDNNRTGDHLRFLAGKVDEHEDVCEAGLEPNYATGGCDPHKWAKIHKAEDAFFSLTVLILVLFFIELNVEMIVLRPSIFFRQFFYALDYCIVFVSLVSELTFHFLSEDNYATLVGFLVFVRIWRFVRIGHGIIEVTSELTHRKYERLLAYTEEMEALVKEHNLERPHCPDSVQKALDEHASNSHHTQDSGS